MNRKRLIPVVAGGVVVVLVALVVLWITVWAPPSKTDFKTAQADAQAISDTKVSPLISQYISAVTTQSQAGKTYDQFAPGLKNQKSHIEANLAKREASNQKIKSSKVRRDTDVSNAYDTYAAKEQKFQQYAKGYTEAYPLFRSSFTTCAPIFDVADKAVDFVKDTADVHRKASQPCLKDLRRLAAVKGIDPLAMYGRKFIAIVEMRQKAFDDFKSGKISGEILVQKLKKTGDAVRANQPPIDKLSKLAKSSSFNGELKALIAVLKKKAA